MQNNTTIRIIPWKKYLSLTFTTLLYFYLSTLSLAVFFTHRSDDGLWLGAILIFLYLSIITMLIKKIINELSLPALMLVIPIAPFIAVVVILSFIPLLQLLK